MKRIYRSPVMAGLLFALAVVLLFAAGIGGTQAALSSSSRNYYSALELKHVDVTLSDSGALGAASATQLGRAYPCVITASNTGEISQYVRVVVYRYWQDASGQKLVNTAYRPDLIRTLAGGSTEGYHDSDWYLDKDSSTAERQVYYYTQPLAVGETTAVTLFDQIMIDPAVVKIVRIGSDGSYEYVFDGLTAVVEYEVDAVQTHHAADAMRSAWGVSDTLLATLNIPND